MDKFRSFSFKIVLFFIFFPYIGFIQNIDTQPNFILLSSVLFFVFYNRYRLSYRFLSVFFGLLAFYFFSLLLNSEYIEFSFFVTYLVVLLNFLFIYAFISSDSLKVTSTTVTVFFFIYVVVGLVQFIYPDFLSWVVTRSDAATLSFSESGRGVRSLSAEPATLGKIFNVFNVLLVFLLFSESKFQIEKKPFLGLLISLIILFFNIVVSRSAYAVGIQLIFILIYMFVFYRRLFFVLLVVSLLSISILVGFISEFQSYRIGKVFYLALNEPSLLLEQGAIRRLLNIPISLNNLEYYGMLGSTNNPATFFARLPTPFGDLYYLAHNRNLGGFIEWILKFGVLGLPLILVCGYLLFSILRYYVLVGRRKYSIGIYLFTSTLLLTFQDGSPTAPFTWFVFLYIFFTLKRDFFRYI